MVFQISEETISDITPGTLGGELILSDGKSFNLSDNNLPENAVRAFVIDSKGINYQIPANKPQVKEIQNTLRTLQGMECLITLSDGTRVHLNAETRLTYPVCFSSKERIVQIEGEAYFEVAKDAKKPFTVQFMSSSVTVLGTSFNIRAYPEEKRSQTTLAEGSVRIYSPGSSMLLKPGEQAEVSALSGEMVKQEVEVKNFTSWKDGRFVFEQQPLEDIMRTLERWYDIRVIFKDEGAKRISLSGNMKRYGDFSQVMKMLQMTGDVRFELHGNDVYITTE